MIETTKRQKQAKVLRIFRKIHRTTGALLFVFFFIVAITGILLGWKKNSNGILLSESYKGSSTDLKDWLPIDSLHKNACIIFADSISPFLSQEIDRIDIRKNDGMVKFVFIFCNFKLLVFYKCKSNTTERIIHRFSEHTID